MVNNFGAFAHGDSFLFVLFVQEEEVCHVQSAEYENAGS